MWNDEIFLDVHELIGSDGSQLVKLFPQRIQAALQELINGIAF